MTPMTSLPDELPSLDVSPGPSRAEPLPADRPVGWGILASNLRHIGLALAR